MPGIAKHEREEIQKLYMNKSLLAIVLTFLGAGGFLMYQASRSGTSLVLTPVQVLAQGKDTGLNRIRVAGTVSSSEILYQVEPDIVLNFHIEDPSDASATLPVVYHGVKPDMFAVGRGVMIDGDYVGGKLEASKLLTQCPSKYEPLKPGGEK